VVRILRARALEILAEGHFDVVHVDGRRTRHGGRRRVDFSGSGGIVVAACGQREEDGEQRN